MLCDMFLPAGPEVQLKTAPRPFDCQCAMMLIRSVTFEPMFSRTYLPMKPSAVSSMPVAPITLHDLHTHRTLSLLCIVLRCNGNL